MPTVDDLLERWRAADLMDEATADRIRAYERGHAERPPAEERPTVLEALVYLGLAIVAVGVGVLVGSNWSSLAGWAKVGVLVVPGLLAVAAGQALRTVRTPGMVRGGHMVWAVATGLLAGAAAVWSDLAGADGIDVGTVAALVGLVVALGLWFFAPSHPQMLVLGVALFMTATTLSNRTDEHTLLFQGVLALVFGAAVIALCERGVLRPRESATVVGALLAAWGAFFAGFDSGGAEMLAFLVAGALIALSIWRGIMIYMLAGVALGFAALIRLIASHVHDPTLASLALIIVGALLIAAVLLITRTKPWRLNRTPA